MKMQTLSIVPWSGGKLRLAKLHKTTRHILQTYS